MIKERLANESWFSEDNGYRIMTSESTYIYAFKKGFNVGRPKWHFIKDKDFPTKEGIYLTWRHFGSDKYPQILAFDGKYWVVGNDHPDNMIVAWQEIIPPKELDDDN